MGPHPEAPVDVQKYIGSYLITQQPRSKRKPCPRHQPHHLPPGHHHQQQQQHGEKSAGCNTYVTSSSPPLALCNCQRNIDICNGYQQSHNHQQLKNYAWTGLPLISIANARPKNRGSSLLKNRVIVPPLHGKALTNRDYSPECPGIVGLEDILPISRLAIHAQGAPLIISSGDREKSDAKCLVEYRNDFDVDRRGFCWNGHCTGGSSSSGSSGSGSPPVLATSNFCYSRSFSQEDKLTAVQQEDADLNRQMSPLPISDSVSTTSEDSGTSENGLPRIIKPRKRRKKDRRMCVGYGDPHNGNHDAVGGAIVTLKPYQPLCYGYAEKPGSNGQFVQTTSPNPSPSKDDKYHNCDIPSSPVCTKKADIIYGTPPEHPHSPPNLCSCLYCVPPPAAIITPPDSPVERYQINKYTPPPSDDWQKRSSSCQVSTKIVSSPRGHRDIEIKFLPSSSTEFGKNNEAPTTFAIKTESTPRRPWIPILNPNPSISSCTFTVMCYNILCDKYATRQMYGYCPNWALDWEYRKKNIMNEILQYKADIISLQEVETEQFYHFFLPELKREGYDGIFSPKSRAKTMSECERKHVDGCAIFFKTNKFFLVREYLVEFNQLAMANSEGCNDMLNRVMTKDNIGLAALLQTKIGAYGAGSDLSRTNQTLLVCTAHIHWDPEYSDVKLIQTMMLMHELQSIVKDTLQKCDNPNVQKDDVNSIPLLLCGDFNSLPNSGVIEFLSSGRVSTKHCDFKQIVYEECLRKLKNSIRSKEFAHPFKISRAYNDEIMPFTNYSYDFKGVIDYVFYSHLNMTILGVLGPVDEKWLRTNRVHGCPHPDVPSDHFPILVELQLAPTEPIHPALPNGIALHR